MPENDLLLLARAVSVVGTAHRAHSTFFRRQGRRFCACGLFVETIEAHETHRSAEIVQALQDVEMFGDSERLHMLEEALAPFADIGYGHQWAGAGGTCLACGQVHPCIYERARRALPDTERTPG